MPVSALRPWLGNLALIDVTGSAPYFRLCGSSLRERFGSEMTSYKIDSLSEECGRHELRSSVETARQTLKPTHTVHERRSDSTRTIFHELCLPLGHDEKQPDIILLASYSETSHNLKETTVQDSIEALEALHSNDEDLHFRFIGTAIGRQFIANIQFSSTHERSGETLKPEEYDFMALKVLSLVEDYIRSRPNPALH